MMVAIIALLSNSIGNSRLEASTIDYGIAPIGTDAYPIDPDAPPEPAFDEAFTANIPGSLTAAGEFIRVGVAHPTLDEVYFAYNIPNRGIARHRLSTGQFLSYVTVPVWRGPNNLTDPPAGNFNTALICPTGDYAYFTLDNNQRRGASPPYPIEPGGTVVRIGLPSREGAPFFQYLGHAAINRPSTQSLPPSFVTNGQVTFATETPRAAMIDSTGRWAFFGLEANSANNVTSIISFDLHNMQYRSHREISGFGDISVAAARPDGEVGYFASTGVNNSRPARVQGINFETFASASASQVPALLPNRGIAQF